jgi:hypothetical protein
LVGLLLSEILLFNNLSIEILSNIYLLLSLLPITSISSLSL